VKRIEVLVIAALAGCSWSTFDDLAASTPVRAVEKPDGLKASDFAVAIVGVTQATETTGGHLAVLSAGAGNYSTIDFDADAATSLGDTEGLGIHTIDSLTPNAILLTNGAGQAAIVDNGNSAVIVGIHGSVNGLSADMQIPTANHPDAALYAGDRLLIFAAPDSTTPNMTNAYNLIDNVACRLLDDQGADLSVVAAAADDTNLWVWTKTGSFFAYPIAVLDPGATCTDVPGMVVTTTAPTTGGHIDLLSHYAILTAFDAPAASAPMGQVIVVDTTAVPPAAVGTPLIAHNVRAVAIDTFDGVGAVALGYPGRTVGTTTNAGEVDLHAFDPSTGELTASPSQMLSIAQADPNLTFGRTLTTMRYNNAPILVVGATNVIYAYLETTLYMKR
jgi:hypothetical protein